MRMLREFLMPTVLGVVLALVLFGCTTPPEPEPTTTTTTIVKAQAPQPPPTVQPQVDVQGGM